MEGKRSGAGTRLYRLWAPNSGPGLGLACEAAILTTGEPERHGSDSLKMGYFH